MSAPARRAGIAGTAPGRRRAHEQTFGTLRVFGVLSALVTVSALGLMACGGDSPHSPSQSVASGNISSETSPHLVGVTGGTATIVLDQVPTTLNDHTPSGDAATTRDVASAIWPQVFQLGPQQTPVLDTDVVQSAELVNINPQTVVYQINPRATWSDGVPISAQDFIYAWLAQKGGGVDIDGTPDSVASTLGYRDIQTVTGGNDDKTVTVVFRTPFGDWPSLFDDLLPAHVAERVGWNHGFDTFDPSVLVSGGPWEAASWEPGNRIVLVRNPHWWGTAPHLDRIVIEADPVPENALGLLTKRSADIGYPTEFDTSVLAQLSSTASVETTESLGTTMLQLIFNTKHPPLDNAFIREGIAHEIDRAGIITSLIQPLNSSVWEDNDHLFSNTQPQYSDGAAGYVQADPVAAARAFAQGGLAADSNGTWTSHGKSLDLELVWAQDDPWSAMVEPSVAAQLTDAGFDVQEVPVTSAQLESSILPAGSFDLALAPMVSNVYPSGDAGYFSTSPVLTIPGTNLDWSGFDDPHVDTTLAQAVQQLGSNQANPLYKQADADLWTEMPTYPLFAEPTLLVHSAWVNAVTDDPGGLGPMFSVEKWYRVVEIKPNRH